MIVLENEPARHILKSQLSKDMDDAVIINVNYLEKPTDHYVDRKGLTAALVHAGSDKKIIIISFEAEDVLAQDQLFASLREKPNVAFLHLPATIEDYRRTYAALKQKMPHKAK